MGREVPKIPCDIMFAIVTGMRRQSSGEGEKGREVNGGTRAEEFHETQR
jgi:hypothetical protein